MKVLSFGRPNSNRWAKGGLFISSLSSFRVGFPATCEHGILFPLGKALSRQFGHGGFFAAWNVCVGAIGGWGLAIAQLMANTNSAIGLVGVYNNVVIKSVAGCV
jgi:hypothetical protein